MSTPDFTIEDVQAVIDSAKVRDDGKLEEFIRGALADIEEEQVTEVAEVAMEVIESVPILLARAAQAADQKNLTVVVMPLLDHAARYFVNPVDMIPEMTHGVAGLLDDTYLALKILENLNRGPEPLFDADFNEPLEFLRRLVGPHISERLDVSSLRALRDVSANVNRIWEELGHEA